MSGLNTRYYFNVIKMHLCLFTIKQIKFINTFTLMVPIKENLNLLIKGSAQVAQLQRTRLLMQERQETQVQSVGGEDPLEKEMAIHSSIVAWKILAWLARVHGIAKSQTQLSMHPR